MSQFNHLSRRLSYYGFIAVCAGSFALCSAGFLFYRLLLKPLVFGFIFLLSSPLILREMMHRHIGKS